MLEEEGTWVSNKWDGDYKFYYENGQTSLDFHFVNGKREGEQKYFYDNGKLNIEGSWKNGEESGVLKEYNEQGRLKAEKNFNKGKMDTASSKFYTVPVGNVQKVKVNPQQKAEVEVESIEGFKGTGNYKLKNTKKQLVMEGVFNKGSLMDGSEYIYNASGKLAKTVIYKNGKKTSVLENN